MIKDSIPVSIIVPTYNSAQFLRDCLESIRKVDYPNYELIVVDGGSKDSTVKMAKNFGAKVFTETRGTRGAACNVGLSVANGKILAFTDADCVVEVDWLKKIVGHFKDLNVAVIGGRDLTPENDPYLAKCIGLSEHFRRNPRTMEDIVMRIKGCNSAYNKAILEKLGGFNESLKYFEETELHWRIYKAGYSLDFDPNIIVWHKRRRSIIKYIKLCYYGGREMIKIAELVPNFMKPKDLALAMVTLLLIVLSGLALVYVWAGLTVIAMTLALFCIGLKNYLQRTESDRIHSLLGYLFVFYVYCLVKGLGILVGMLAPNRSSSAKQT